MQSYRCSWQTVARCVLVLSCFLALSLTAAFAQEAAIVEVPKEKVQVDVPVPSYTFNLEYDTPVSVVPPEHVIVQKKVDSYKTWRRGGPYYFVSTCAKRTQKLVRGIHNVAFGWVEIPKTVMIDTMMVEPFCGFFTGIFHGAARTVERTGVGAIEIVTFWHEWPYEYQPIIEPEYVWDDLTD